EAENQFHRDAIEGLRGDHDRARERLDVLLNLRLDQSITQNDYDKKARELKQRQAEIELRIEQQQKWRSGFPNHARKLGFIGFSSCRPVRAFENRAKAPIDRFRLFELTAQG